MAYSSGNNAPPPPEHNYGYTNAPQETLSKKKRPSRTAPIVISGLVGVLIGVGGTLGALALTTGLEDAEEPVAGAEEEPTVEPEETEPSTEEETSEEPSIPSPSRVDLTTDDFEIETSVKEQRCFGSAGCNLTIRTEPVFVGSGVPAGVWEVTYEITGIEDQPMIRTFELDDDLMSFDDEARVSVESENFDIQTEVTEVREGFVRQ